MRVEILCTGDEILSGKTINTNYSHIARRLGELGLDIRHAKIQTLGNEVVDTFYVRNDDRLKVTDPFHLKEIERALLFAVG